ncbi:hypothetical protein SETIT_6G245100v2 [Setaria italica]|uniref:DUF1618 domain-containing protein n=1 Tax=Setaria italica TaxID=4555 RepID=K3YH86_SETIT|nr:uncharacterized protein LOC101770755 [Setaria italica]RCV32267.1 hypothetical protein SETIT_6G245100v2 [Setaria italica]
MAAPLYRSHHPRSNFRSYFISLQSPRTPSMTNGAVDPPDPFMVLVDAFIPIIDEVSALIVENGGPSHPPFWGHIPFPPSVSPKERAAAQQRAVAEGLLRYRRELEWPAEDILRERRASNPSAVRKLVAFGGWEAALYLAILDGIEPHLEIPHPPGVASLVLSVSAGARDTFNQFPSGASIAGADHNIIAMYAGPYRPTFPPPGFYLVYDSLANSLAAVLPLPPSSASQFTHRGVGAGTAVLRHDPPSEYVLAELLYHRTSSTQATLFTWCSSGAVAGQWINKEVVLPFPLPSDPAYIFCADVVFALGDNSICWVDLLKGILICDKVMDDPKFRFISLPKGYSRSWHPEQGRGRPRDFSSMCSVRGDTVRFVHMNPASDIDDLITLTTWTLCISNSVWKKGGSFRIIDVWADPTYEELKLPKKVPRCPILSLLDEEDGVVYLTVAENNCQYVFSVDVERRMVVSGNRLPPEGRQFSRIMAVEVTMHLNKRRSRTGGEHLVPLK